jgi:hypothetical protein
LQGCNRLHSVGDGGGTSESKEQLQQTLTDERNRSPDQREQPLLPAPECREDPA